jgi:hypothetical protein
VLHNAHQQSTCIEPYCTLNSLMSSWLRSFKSAKRPPVLQTHFNTSAHAHAHAHAHAVFLHPAKEPLPPDLVAVKVLYILTIPPNTINMTHGTTYMRYHPVMLIHTYRHERVGRIGSSLRSGELAISPGKNPRPKDNQIQDAEYARRQTNGSLPTQTASE